ncbi:MAG: succinate dehydrogenase/fumarate reductase iron-sulfur subunit [Candidatus Thorarchaeota archaeon]|nr:succinate dehydrogenase/fumarate reductase iron-sulfur subunit [Candidatus Thorarchaeota archaeon]
MMFRIARSRAGGSITHYDLYKVDTKNGMTVLDALFQIQDRMDPSLSFRYSCRGAVCGSCSMLINKEPRLACRTQIADVKGNDMKLKPFPAITETPKGWNSDGEILIEPLPNMPILNDLVVDMTKFYDGLESMKLWNETEDGDTSRSQNPEERKKIERYVNCILCALCYGSCPINAVKEEYVGPAALAKTWRFHEDTRTVDPERFAKTATQPEGAPLCDLILNCVKACPKGVAPGGAIRKIKSL